jgi:hypothetical protein
VKHAQVSQTVLASLYVYRLDSLLVLRISAYDLHLYKQRSNKTYSCSRLIKLAQATRAQKAATRNMAQALCEPAPNDATKSIANFNTGFNGYFNYQIPGICAINYLASIDIFSRGIFGILILIIQHLFQLSCMHIYY